MNTAVRHCVLFLAGIVCSVPLIATPPVAVAASQESSILADVSRANRDMRDGRLREAQAILATCLDRCRKMSPPNPTLLANVLNSLGTAERMMGDYRSALKRYEETLQVLKNRPSDARGTDDFSTLRARAVAHDGIGVCQSALGRYSEAISSYEKATKTWKELGRTLSRKDPRRTVVQEGLFGTAINLAATCKSQDPFQKMLILTSKGRRAVPIHLFYQVLIEKIEEELGESHVCLGRAHLGLADYYWRIGRFDLIDEPAKRGLNLMGYHRDVPGELSGEYLRIISRLILSKPGSGQYEDAAQELEDLRERCVRCGLDLWAARILSRLAEDCRRRERWDEAERLYGEAIEILDQRGALPIARYNAWHGLAMVLHRRGDTSGAVSCLEEAVRIVRVAAATTIGGDVGYDSYSAQFTAAYDLLVALLLEQNDPEAVEKALYYAHEAYRRLLDVQLQCASKQHTDPELERLREEREQLLRANPFIVTGSKEARKLRQLEERILQCVKRMQDDDPTRRRLLGKGLDFEPFRRSLAALRERDQLVLYYYLGARRSFLFAITQGGIDHRELTVTVEDAKALGVEAGPFTRGLAEHLVDTCLDEIAHSPVVGQPVRGHVPVRGPRPKPSPSPSQLAQAAIALTETILPGDVLEQMQQAKRAVIVPNGALRKLPFCALAIEGDQNGRVYLVDRSAPISYAYSICGQGHSKTGSGSHQQRSQIVSFGTTSLDGAQEEVRRLIDLCRRFGIEPIGHLGKGATEESLREHADEARLLHIAAHALYENWLDNWFGHIALEGGDLELHEILSLDLAGCEAVVLSVCEANVGSPRKLYAGNSLALAFLAAGAERVVASHWRVNDEATGQLMAYFFKEVIAEMAAGHPVDYANALHAAKQQLRRNHSQWQSPYYWAGFTVVEASVSDLPQLASVHGVD